MKQPNKDPLSVEEITKASERFFPLFDVVMSKMPEGATVEDALKVMESVAKLAHKLRLEEEEESSKFGFNKKEEATDE